LVEKFDVYPNSANDILNINYISDTSVEVVIMDLNGQTVQIIEEFQDSKTINIENLTNEIYFLKSFNTNAEILTKKIIVL